MPPKRPQVARNCEVAVQSSAKLRLSSSFYKGDTCKGGYLDAGGKLTWISNGGKFYICNQKNGQVLFYYSYMSLPLGKEFEILTCKKLGNSLFVVINIGGESGFVSVFNFSTKVILKNIQIPYLITSFDCVAEENWSQDERNLFSKQLHWMHGIAAIGTTSGRVYLVDLRLDSVANSNFTEIQPVAIIVRDIKRMRQQFNQQQLHMSFELSELSDESERFHYRNQEDEILESYASDKVHVTSIYFEKRSLQLFVGFSFGQFQIFDLRTLSLVFSSTEQESTFPVVDFTLQEPENDPKNVCYAWVVRNSNKKSRTGLTSSMYGIEFEDKESQTYSNDKLTSLYSGLMNCGLMYFSQHDVTSSTKSCRILQCNALELFNCNEQANGSFYEDTAPSTSLFLLSWECVNNGVDVFTNIFDINSWYVAQMPSNSQQLEDNRSYCTQRKMNAIFENNFERILALHTCGDSLRSVKTRIHPIPQQFLIPDALSFTTCCLQSNRVSYFSTYGIQKQVTLDLHGIDSLVNSDHTYEQMCSVGLIDTYHADGKLTSENQRISILNAAFNHNLKSYMTRVINDLVEGSRIGLDFTTNSLIDWAWKTVTSVKEEFNRLCVPIFDCSSSVVEDDHFAKLSIIRSQLKDIGDILQMIYRDAKSSKVTVVHLLRQYMRMMFWLIDANILPAQNERSDVKFNFFYKRADLQKIFNSRRNQMRAIQTNDRNDDGGCLMIDGLINFSDADILKRWSNFTPSSVTTSYYPPPSVLALLDIFYMDTIDDVTKKSIILYFLLDVVSMNGEEITVLNGGDGQQEGNEARLYQSSMEIINSYPRTFFLPNETTSLIRAFWLLDRGNLEESFDKLCEAGVSKILQDWHHQRILRMYICEKRSDIALRYLWLLNPPCHNTEDVKLHLNILCDNRQFYQAFELAKTKSKTLKDGDIFCCLFQLCYRNNTLRQLLSLQLSRQDDELLCNFLRQQSSQRSNDMLVLHHLMKSRHMEAIQSFRGRNTSNQQKDNSSEKGGSKVFMNKLIGCILNIIPDIKRQNIITSISRNEPRSKQFPVANRAVMDAHRSRAPTTANLMDISSAKKLKHKKDLMLRKFSYDTMSFKNSPVMTPSRATTTTSFASQQQTGGLQTPGRQQQKKLKSKLDAASSALLQSPHIKERASTRKVATSRLLLDDATPQSAATQSILKSSTTKPTRMTARFSMIDDPQPPVDTSQQLPKKLRFDTEAPEDEEMDVSQSSIMTSDLTVDMTSDVSVASSFYDALSSPVAPPLPPTITTQALHPVEPAADEKLALEEAEETEETTVEESVLESICDQSTGEITAAEEEQVTTFVAGEKTEEVDQDSIEKSAVLSVESEQLEEEEEDLVDRSAESSLEHTEHVQESETVADLNSTVTSREDDDDDCVLISSDEEEGERTQNSEELDSSGLEVGSAHDEDDDDEFTDEESIEDEVSDAEEEILSEGEVLDEEVSEAEEDMEADSDIEESADLSKSEALDESKEELEEGEVEESKEELEEGEVEESKEELEEGEVDESFEELEEGEVEESKEELEEGEVDESFEESQEISGTEEAEKELTEASLQQTKNTQLDAEETEQVTSQDEVSETEERELPEAEDDLPEAEEDVPADEVDVYGVVVKESEEELSENLLKSDPENGEEISQVKVGLKVKEEALESVSVSEAVAIEEAVLATEAKPEETIEDVRESVVVVPSEVDSQIKEEVVEVAEESTVEMDTEDILVDAEKDNQGVSEEAVQVVSEIVDNVSKIDQVEETTAVTEDGSAVEDVLEATEDASAVIEDGSAVIKDVLEAVPEAEVVTLAEDCDKEVSTSTGVTEEPSVEVSEIDQTSEEAEKAVEAESVFTMEESAIEDVMESVDPEEGVASNETFTLEITEDEEEPADESGVFHSFAESVEGEVSQVQHKDVPAEEVDTNSVVDTVTQESKTDDNIEQPVNDSVMMSPSVHNSISSDSSGFDLVITNDEDESETLSQELSEDVAEVEQPLELSESVLESDTPAQELIELSGNVVENKQPLALSEGVAEVEQLLELSEDVAEVEQPLALSEGVAEEQPPEISEGVAEEEQPLEINEGVAEEEQPFELSEGVAEEKQPFELSEGVAEEQPLELSEGVAEVEQSLELSEGVAEVEQTLELSEDAAEVEQPLELSEGAAEVEQPLELSEGAAEVEQPLELSEDVAEVEQPLELSEDVAEVEQPLELSEGVAEVEQPLELSEDAAEVEKLKDAVEDEKPLEKSGDDARKVARRRKGRKTKRTAPKKKTTVKSEQEEEQLALADEEKLPTEDVPSEETPSTSQDDERLSSQQTTLSSVAEPLLSTRRMTRSRRKEITTSTAPPSDEADSTSEAPPRDEAIPKEEASPSDEAAPKEEASPSDETAPKEEASPSDEVAPTAEASPSGETAPSEEAPPSDEAALIPEAHPHTPVTKKRKATIEHPFVWDEANVGGDHVHFALSPPILRSGKRRRRDADPMPSIKNEQQEEIAEEKEIPVFHFSPPALRTRKRKGVTEKVEKVKRLKKQGKKTKATLPPQNVELLSSTMKFVPISKYQTPSNFPRVIEPAHIPSSSTFTDKRLPTTSFSTETIKCSAPTTTKSVTGRRRNLRSRDSEKDSEEVDTATSDLETSKKKTFPLPKRTTRTLRKRTDSKSADSSSEAISDDLSTTDDENTRTTTRRTSSRRKISSQAVNKLETITEVPTSERNIGGSTDDGKKMKKTAVPTKLGRRAKPRSRAATSAEDTESEVTKRVLRSTRSSSKN